MEGGVLRPEQEGQDSSGAGSQGVTHDHQAVVHGALVLPGRHTRHSRGRLRRQRRHRHAARRAAYQVSSEGLRQDHFLLQLLLNVLCRVNHPLAEERQTERRVEDGKKSRNIDRKLT